VDLQSSALHVDYIAPPAQGIGDGAQSSQQGRYVYRLPPVLRPPGSPSGFRAALRLQTYGWLLGSARLWLNDTAPEDNDDGSGTTGDDSTGSPGQIQGVPIVEVRCTVT
jgi:hypothetical protein